MSRASCGPTPRSGMMFPGSIAAGSRSSGSGSPGVFGEPAGDRSPVRRSRSGSARPGRSRRRCRRSCGRRRTRTARSVPAPGSARRLRSAYGALVPHRRLDEQRRRRSPTSAEQLRGSACSSRLTTAQRHECNGVEHDREQEDRRSDDPGGARETRSSPRSSSPSERAATQARDARPHGQRRRRRRSPPPSASRRRRPRASRPAAASGLLDQVDRSPAVSPRRAAARASRTRRARRRASRPVLIRAARRRGSGRRAPRHDDEVPVERDHARSGRRCGGEPRASGRSPARGRARRRPRARSGRRSACSRSIRRRCRAARTFERLPDEDHSKTRNASPRSSASTSQARPHRVPGVDRARAATSGMLLDDEEQSRAAA